MQTNGLDVTTSPGFWANLNVFIPAWVVLNVTVGWMLSMALMAPLVLVSFVTGPFGEAPWLQVLQVLCGPVLITAFLFRRWARHGLVPAPILRLSRYRTGQGLLVLVNAMLPGGFVALGLYSQFVAPDVSVVMGWMWLPLFMVAIPAAALGLWLVWSSRSAPAMAS